MAKAVYTGYRDTTKGVYRDTGMSHGGVRETLRGCTGGTASRNTHLKD